MNTSKETYCNLPTFNRPLCCSCYTLLCIWQIAWYVVLCQLLKGWQLLYHLNGVCRQVWTKSHLTCWETYNWVLLPGGICFILRQIRHAFQSLQLTCRQNFIADHEGPFQNLLSITNATKHHVINSPRYPSECRILLTGEHFRY